jgi:hypothetical protein
MASLLEDHQSGPVVGVLYVEHCPNFPAALALVERVAAELGVDTQVQATMITDLAAAEHARFVGSPTVRRSDLMPDLRRPVIGRPAATFTTPQTPRQAAKPAAYSTRPATSTSPSSPASGWAKRAPPLGVLLEG